MIKLYNNGVYLLNGETIYENKDMLSKEIGDVADVSELKKALSLMEF